jgi:hypothetical protein
VAFGPIEGAGEVTLVGKAASKSEFCQVELALE